MRAKTKRRGAPKRDRARPGRRDLAAKPDVFEEKFGGMLDPGWWANNPDPTGKTALALHPTSRFGPFVTKKEAEDAWHEMYEDYMARSGARETGETRQAGEWKGWTEKMPVQVVTRSGTEEFRDLDFARRKYPELDPKRNTSRFTWAMKGEVDGRRYGKRGMIDAIRFEDWPTYRQLSSDEPRRHRAQRHRATESLARGEIGDWRASGRQDAANVIDVNEIASDLGERPTRSVIKAWLLRDVEESLDQFAFPPTATKGDRTKLLDAWADGWSEYAERVMLERASDREDASRENPRGEGPLGTEEREMVRFRFEDERSWHTCTLTSFRKHNPDLLDDEDLYILRSGGRVWYGGGAQPLGFVEIVEGGQSPGPRRHHREGREPLQGELESMYSYRGYRLGYDRKRDDYVVSPAIGGRTRYRTQSDIKDAVDAELHRKHAHENPQGGEPLPAAETHRYAVGDEFEIPAGYQHIDTTEGTVTFKKPIKVSIVKRHSASGVYAVKLHGKPSISLSPRSATPISTQFMVDDSDIRQWRALSPRVGEPLPLRGGQRQTSYAGTDPANGSPPARQRARDYDSVDDALAKVHEFLGAEWYVRRGDKVTVYWEEEMGDYLEATLVKARGLYHWPANWGQKKVKALPKGAIAINVSRSREANECPTAGDVPSAENGVPWVKLARDPEQYAKAMELARELGPIDSAGKVYELLSPALAREDQEVFLVVCLDIRSQLRGVAEVHRGERSRVSVDVSDVLRVAIADGAEGFIVVHNHPTGKASPSDADGELTKAIMTAAKKVDLICLDHVVIGLGEHYSFADDKLTKVKKKGN